MASIDWSAVHQAGEDVVAAICDAVEDLDRSTLESQQVFVKLVDDGGKTLYFRPLSIAVADNASGMVDDSAIHAFESALNEEKGTTKSK